MQITHTAPRATKPQEERMVTTGSSDTRATAAEPSSSETVTASRPLPIPGTAPRSAIAAAMAAATTSAPTSADPRRGGGALGHVARADRALQSRGRVHARRSQGAGLRPSDGGHVRELRGRRAVLRSASAAALHPRARLVARTHRRSRGLALPRQRRGPHRRARRERARARPGEPARGPVARHDPERRPGDVPRTDGDRHPAEPGRPPRARDAGHGAIDGRLRRAGRLHAALPAARCPALGALVERFEALASDAVAARDGRVVKLVGDAVMFVAVDPSAACDIALTLLERFAGDPAVTPRGGLAEGRLLARGGDYYGSAVNLASRLGELAVPREVLATAEVASAAARDRFRFEPAGRRILKGFDAPVALYAVARP